MEKIYEVFEITSGIKKNLETNYPYLQVQGELSGVSHSLTGHLYFRLKDSKAQISCVFFRFANKNVNFDLANGTKVIVSARISVYEPQGTYQLIVEKISLLGVGELQIRFEELKKKLQTEGYFDLVNKKKVPPFPQKIGIVTSLQAAALKDVLKILKRRAPQIKIIIANSLVQGEKAPTKLISAIEVLEKINDVDLILITRGGGVIEDLWCFNNEKLAKKIFTCQKPTICAIGHESDLTICDLVADKRTATPSEAAEMLSNNSKDLLEKINYLEHQLRQIITTKLEILTQNISKLGYQLGNPLYKIQNYFQRTDELITRIEQNLTFKISQEKSKIIQTTIILKQTSLLTRTLLLKQEIGSHKENIKNYFFALLQKKEKKFLALNSEIEFYNPLRVLKQGYARIRNKKGLAVKKITQLEIGEFLKMEFRDGIALTSVQQILEKLPTK